MRLCVFALTLQLEQSALDLALLQPDRAWAALNDGRQAKAREVYEQRGTAGVNKLLALHN